jgi:hypothetical protein
MARRLTSATSQSDKRLGDDGMQDFIVDTTEAESTVATVESHGPQMANNSLAGGRAGGLATVASHDLQLGNGGHVTGHHKAGRRKDGKKKKRKRCLACVKAGRDPECYSCKGRGPVPCPHLR